MSNQRRAMRPTRFVRPPSGLLSVMLLFALTPVLADDTGLDTSTVEFRIPAQTVPAALGEFARQAQVQLFFISDGFENVRANAVFGAYTRQHALNLLLAGTGLRASLSPDSELEVRPVSSSMSAETGDESLLAAAKLSAEEEEAQGSDVGLDGDGAESADAESGKQRRALEEIVVTGTHIRGVDNVGASSITFTREELDATGYSTVGEVFESLPQNLDEINVDGTAATGVSVVAASNTPLASGISLRGLGPGSTLVLLNGKRRPASIHGRAVDVASIPFSMVERIEVVTGGRSAVYGSDAVAGVANIITRTSFDGAETQVSYGEASDGAEQFNFSQTFGRDFDRGGFVIGYDYRNEGELDATATGLIHAPSPFGITPLPGLYRIRVPSEQHVSLFAARYEINDKAELYADVHYSDDRNEGGQLFNLLDVREFGGIFITESDQYSAVLGSRIEIANDWQLDVSGLYGGVDNTIDTNSVNGPVGTYTSLDLDPTHKLVKDSRLNSFTVIADGSLGRLRGEPVSAAIGVDFRHESYDSARTDLSNGTTELQESGDRDVVSLFGEVLLPIVGGDRQRLDVSLAARYDDYSDFGDTFNPQIGVEWKPAEGLVFRGSYSTAFRAPSLFNMAGAVIARANLIDDPLAPGTTVTLFSETGGNRDLQPEEADTYTIGLDWELMDRSRLSLSWFSIEYEGRIDRPLAIFLQALQEESILGALVDRNPTPENLDALLNNSDIFQNSTNIPFDPAVDDPYATFSNIVTFDGRTNNIGLEEITGLDFQARTAFKTASGDWSFGLNGAYYFDFTRNVTELSPKVENLNTPGRPVDLKVRAQLGLARQAWNINAYVNYTNSYNDNIAETPTKIDSWTTVDLSLRYDASQAFDNGFLDGFVATLRVSNALDEDPPVFLNNLFGLAYDGVNASPVGRFVSLRLSKRW
ncbi:MAG: TonB-dependent receptor [Woeseia sp.]